MTSICTHPGHRNNARLLFYLPIRFVTQGGGGGRCKGRGGRKNAKAGRGLTADATISRRRSGAHHACSRAHPVRSPPRAGSGLISRTGTQDLPSPRPSSQGPLRFRGAGRSGIPDQVRDDAAGQIPPDHVPAALLFALFSPSRSSRESPGSSRVVAVPEPAVPSPIRFRAMRARSRPVLQPPRRAKVAAGSFTPSTRPRLAGPRPVRRHPFAPPGPKVPRIVDSAEPSPTKHPPMRDDRDPSRASPPSSVGPSRRP